MFSFLKKWFSKPTPIAEKQASNEISLTWIEAKDNEWGVRLLDLRPVTQGLTSTSQDPTMADNALSYGQHDGTSFWNQPVLVNKTVEVELRYSIDQVLEAGSLFIPRKMEQKWAIYFDGEYLIFVRSWQKQVMVRAKTIQQNNELVVVTIEGEFLQDENPEFTKSICNYLIISHCLGQVVPTPLPKELESNTQAAAFLAFSLYGNMALAGVFDEHYLGTSPRILRGYPLSHYYAAVGDTERLKKQLNNKAIINSIAQDGWELLSRATLAPTTAALEMLLLFGALPNECCADGETPIMFAAEQNKLPFVQVLIQAGSDVNAQDKRGFTALHRAAEMGHLDLVKLLLKYGADKTLKAQNLTALDLAKEHKRDKIIQLLQA